MRYPKSPLFILFFVVPLLLTGCVGISFPNPFRIKPYRMMNDGEQIGRDQLANRLLAAKKLLPLEGKMSNQVLTLLGQPQEVQVIDDGVSEDWLYIYFENISNRISAEKQAFWVRLYYDKVIDVVREP